MASPEEIELRRQLKQWWLADIEESFNLVLDSILAGYRDAVLDTTTAIAARQSAQDKTIDNRVSVSGLLIGLGGAVAAVCAIPSFGTSLAAYGISAGAVATLGGGAAALGFAKDVYATTKKQLTVPQEYEVLYGLMSDRIANFKRKVFSAENGDAMIKKIFDALKDDPKYSIATKQSDTKQLRRQAIIHLFFPKFSNEKDLAKAVRLHAKQMFELLVGKYRAFLNVQSAYCQREIDALPSNHPVTVPGHYDEGPIYIKDPKQVAAIKEKYCSLAATSRKFPSSVQYKNWCAHFSVQCVPGWGLISDQK